MGERKRFDACRLAMATLADARKWGWGEVQRLREQISLETSDARRRESGKAMGFFLDLKRHIEVGAAEAEALTRKAFRGLMAPIWIERYLSDRIEPLREELAALDSRVRVLEPDKYAATIHKRKWNE
jgi:hypothetical protein